MSDKQVYRQYRGRAAGSNRVSRYSEYTRDVYLDVNALTDRESVRTCVLTDHARTIITRNRSPDVPFERSINPYQGCEHGCIYCFARPTHAWLDLSPGLDFESRIFARSEAPDLLAREFSRPAYRPAVIALGANTDAYQPIERKLGITRRLLEVFRQFRHPLVIITKSVLLERDLELLADLARDNLVQVMVSVTTPDAELSRRMEPRAALPARRVQMIRKLSEAGIPVGVLFAPVIPVLNDHAMETVLGRCADAGAQTAGYVMLRLPLELKELFTNWLHEFYPLSADHVMHRIRDLHHGREYEAQFGTRMTGSGHYADLIGQRFKLACRKLGLATTPVCLDCSLFSHSRTGCSQLDLF